MTSGGESYRRIRRLHRAPIRRFKFNERQFNENAFVFPLYAAILYYPYVPRSLSLRVPGALVWSLRRSSRKLCKDLGIDLFPSH